MDSQSLKRSLFEMYRIRMVEDKIVDLYYPEQEMRCPVHLSIGQEATAVGTCKALDDKDVVFSTHRAHAHYLAKGGDLKRMIAELYLRKTGCCGGRGGSMHLNDRDVGFKGAVPIVGSCISIATGAALKFMMKGENHVALTFFGEAASEEGVFYESVNFAALKNLPIIFLCENNLYSVYSPLSVRVPKNRKIIELVKAAGINSEQGDGNNVAEVFSLVDTAVRKARSGGGATFLELMTYRWREHCGPSFDDQLGYRPEGELDHWMKLDPIIRTQEELISVGKLNIEEVEQWKQSIKAEIEEAFDFAKNSPFPDPASLMEGVYAS